MDSLDDTNHFTAGPILTMLLAGMAGGMAWGIRGQYGHETGAMIAGILVGFTLVLLHGRELSSLMCARAVAMFALGISVGGSMTYGQTVGLTHDSPLIGNVDAYRWGMFGLAIKGGVWIAMGAAMFGMALSGRRYRSVELVLLLSVMLGAMLLGAYLFNSPFDPANKVLPKLYFSDHWYWEPDVDKPRRESWGGILAALIVLLTYLGAVKRDRVGFYLGLWGLLAGAVGFPAGQSIQAFNAWNNEWVASLPTSAITQHFNWWNMMETAFGFVMGAIVGLGCWIHRKSIGHDFDSDAESDTVTIQPWLEFVLLFVHVRLLIAWNFQSFDIVDVFADMALPMIAIPAVAVMSGRFWPYLVSLPVVMIPIAGKTVRHFLSSDDVERAVQTTWDFYLVFPIIAATLVSLAFAIRSTQREPNTRFTAVGLLTTTWFYFYLNNAFFHSPWPWREWTARTANGVIFLACSFCLTAAAFATTAIRRNQNDGKV